MEEGKLPESKKKIGWIKIGFLYAASYLNSEMSYEQAMKAALLLGGDTDTNAAIIGGLIGAAVGCDNIPEMWGEKVLNAEYSRPEFLIPKGQLIPLIEKIIENSPKEDGDLIIIE